MTDTLGRKLNFRSDVARAHVEARARPAARMMVKESPAYDGGARELFPIVMLNLVLNLITLGLYRFWAKTRIRRYFLSRISFLGDRLEYTGTGKELFFGFLIVLAVLAPIGVAFEFLGQYAMSQSLRTFAIVQFTYALLFYFLIQVAVYRAQRYRLSRFNWRGIRGAQGGSAMLYALFAMMWSVITLLTLGIAYPLMRRSLQGYKINNARFGDESFHFEGGVGPLFLAWILPWTGLALLITPFVLTGIEQAGAVTVDWQQLAKDPKGLSDVFVHWQLAPAGVLVFLITKFWYRAAEVRYFANRTVFDELRFTSRFKGIELFLVYLLYVSLMAAILWGAWAISSELAVSAEAARALGMSAINLQFVVLAITIIPALFLLGALQPIIVQNLLIHLYCKRLIVSGSFSPERLLQNQLDVPQRGEGLADALDIDAF
ncbi:MAG: YjgN family protein [Alphaproteobacteria bacterium]|nr:YjgN family protein [Alphaproteobacteria bacterium]